jgi:Arc/MetJ family transcription regulator
MMLELCGKEASMPRRSSVTVEDDSGGAGGVVKHTRTTVTLDDDLIRKAQAYTGVKEKSALIREALAQLVRREAARRLATLGGTMPDLQRIPRRRLPRK